MSGNAKTRSWRNGSVVGSTFAFWQSPRTLDAADPAIPSLPLLEADNGPSLRAESFTLSATQIATGGSAVFQLVQTSPVATNTTGATLTATLPATATTGNLLVALAATNDPSITAPAGWSLAVSSDNVGDGDTCGIWYKISDGTETDFVMTTAGNSKHLIVREYSGVDETNPLDLTATSGTAAGVTTRTAGTTGTLSMGSELLVSVWAVRADISAESVDAPYSLNGVGDGTFSAIFGSDITTSNASQTPTANWTTAGTAWAATATFRAATTSGDPTVNESVAVADSQSATGVFGISRAESVAVSDSQTATLVTAGNVLESVALADSQSATLAISTARTESVAMTDSQSSTLSAATARAESVAISDSQDATVSPGASSQTDESVSLADSQAAQLSASAARAETLSIADSQSSIIVAGVDRAESVTFTDSQDASVVVGGTSNTDESVSLSDSQSVSTLYDTQIGESISLSDSFSVTGTFNVGISELFTISDSQSAAGPINVTIGESFSLSDSQTGQIDGVIVDLGAGSSRRGKELSRRSPVLLEYKGRIHEFVTQQGAEEFLRSIAPETIAQVEIKAKRVAKALARTGNEFRSTPVVTVRALNAPKSLLDKIEFSSLAQREMLANMVRDRLEVEKKRALQDAMQLQIAADAEMAEVAAIMLMM